MRTALSLYLILWAAYWLVWMVEVKVTFLMPFWFNVAGHIGVLICGALLLPWRAK